ncbi:bcl-2-like protein 10 [Aix galericulata]|nr:bcl-2-like protein 10 [Aix galericulata]
MPGSLKEETALLLQDYFQHRGGGAALPPSATAATLRRAAAELERRERPFFRSCAPLARAEPREAAALLRRVAAQLEADGGLNWGRLLALVVFAGTLAAALAERGCGEGPRRLAEALAAYLAEERGEWLRAHGGWVSGEGEGGSEGLGAVAVRGRGSAGRCGAGWCVPPGIPPGEAPRLPAPPAVGPVRRGAPGGVGCSLGVEPWQPARYLLKGACFGRPSGSARVCKQAVSCPREL